MNAIKNLQKLSEVFHEHTLSGLDNAARLHLRHSNIEFKIIGITGNSITVRVSQGKSLSENYADEKTLIYRTKELFNQFLPGYVMLIHPVPYVLPVVDVATPEWITDKMLRMSVRIKDIQADTGIDKTNLSAWINGVRPMSQPVKAMFYYYFLNR